MCCCSWVVNDSVAERCLKKGTDKSLQISIVLVNRKRHLKEDLWLINGEVLFRSLLRPKPFTLSEEKIKIILKKNS